MKEGERSAFPWEVHPGAQNFDTGMTLRDWFAGQAIAGAPPVDGYPIGRAWEPHELAGWAFAVADAILAERERTKVAADE